jgi:hypothetical protein
MSNLLMTIVKDFPVIVNYDYDDKEKTICINLVKNYEADIKDILSQSTIETIEQNIFDSFDKELQEPERE